MTIEPNADASAAPRVLRAHVAVADAAGVALFEGELGSYHLARLARRDIPMTLAERSVPTLAWRERPDAGGRLVVAPTVPLEAGATYSIASPLGLLAVLRVAPDSGLPLFTRLWPPPGGDAGGRYAVYCGNEAARVTERRALLEPGRVAARLSPGVDPLGRDVDPCFRLELLDSSLLGLQFLPPPEHAGGLVDPSPLRTTADTPAAPLICEPGEVALADGCARVLDDRMVVRSVGVPSFWIVNAPGARAWFAVPPAARFVVGGLTPDVELAVTATRVETSGRTVTQSLSVRTRPLMPHLVLNEVMANPVGAEPEQEWVEVFNDGRASVDLSGWVVEDIGGATELPSQVVAPGQFALVVSEGYDAASPWDVPPADGALLLRVPKLGKNGLSNSGEPLMLKGPDGTVHSRFPPSPKPKAGISVARRAPRVLDDDPTAFGLHGSPGASPGAPNELD